jgi:plasmid maintenance system antidote protein VapI
MHFGAALYDVVTERGVVLSDLARTLGVHRQQVQTLLSARNTTIATAAKYAEALGMDVAELVSLAMEYDDNA